MIESSAKSAFRPSEIYRLVKGGLGFSILITIVPGLLLGPELPDTALVLSTLFGTYLVAAGSFIYNQILEKERDGLMERTRNRPLPSGRLSPALAHVLGSSCLVVGLLILARGANPLAAALALASFLYYLFVYTAWLKPHTPMNTVAGGMAGAIGPLIGQAAATGRVDIHGFLMFLLLFLWQPPHFWCLAIHYRDDYAKAGFPMLPVARGIPATVRQMLFYEGLLLAVMAAAFYPLGLVGPIFFFPSIALGAIVLGFMVRLRVKPGANPMPIFFLTILHMLVWHISLALDIYHRSFASLV